NYPSETVFVNDENVMHGVSPIKTCNPDADGYRDILVVTFYKKGLPN
ncbi:2OG-Fe dioxygenase family protein, partial [Acinetobacter baumannii]